jgi:hypothetical protein
MAILKKKKKAKFSDLTERLLASEQELPFHGDKLFDIHLYAVA